jgi:hypothetical protein
VEDRLRRAKALIARLPAKYPSDQLDAKVNGMLNSPPGSRTPTADALGSADGGSEEHLENMLDGRGRLTSTKNSTEYYGGDLLSFRTNLFFNQTPLVTELGNGRDISLDAISRLFDSLLPDKRTLTAELPASKLLPSRQAATELLHVVLGQTYQLLQFLHEPTFQKHTDWIYDLDLMYFEDCGHDSLPLFYAVTALGYLFHRTTHQKYGSNGSRQSSVSQSGTRRNVQTLIPCQNATHYCCSKNG